MSPMRSVVHLPYIRGQWEIKVWEGGEVSRVAAVCTFAYGWIMPDMECKTYQDKILKRKEIKEKNRTIDYCTDIK